MSKRKKIKKHFRKNKQLYIGLGIGLGVAGITWLVMRERHATLLSRVDGSKTADSSVTVRSLSVFSKQGDIVVTTVHTGSRGHSGFRVKNLEDGRVFATQADAAREYGISPSILSCHLNGKYKDAQGSHFERISHHQG